MKREEFKQRLAYINLTQETFAIFFELGYSTVKGWKTTPAWVEHMLDYLELSIQLNNIENIKVGVKASNNKREDLITKVQNIALDRKISPKRTKQELKS